MANRHKPPPRQAQAACHSLTALTRRVDWRKWSAARQIEFLFSFYTLAELQQQVEPRSPLLGRFEHWVLGRTLTERQVTRKVLLELAAKRTDLLQRPDTVAAVGGLTRYYLFRVRELDDWQPGSRNVFRQLDSLLRHLFDQYGDVPQWVLEPWSSGQFQHSGVDLRELTIHLGSGRALRSFASVPVPLTKRLEHEMRRAPGGCSFLEALRYGQLAARGALAWIGPVLESRLGREIGPDDEFWLRVADFFAASPMVDPRHFGPVCDWIHHKRTVGIEPEPPQPGFSLQGRTMAGMLAAVEQWHQKLSRMPRHAGHLLTATWVPLPIPDFVSGEDERVRISQLRTYSELVDEGRALRHCVASYLQSCQQGRCGIFSLKIEGARALTLEVLPNRQIVQVRGRYNRGLNEDERYWLKRWARDAQLTLAKYL
ncbi:PcfJ domain-containing protein [Hymenobacter sp. J193]|uniref:PcfJ domain-containing protein n=1 Tax=Hymenobacter sp. J193 TaxID=2898429 RepID=UPI0021506DDD|nr:PcfJ domain-containing protein [Hymenobacter sp. J193]MCR5886575.1 PcfJ domain-containing protein [Hymenobacter sp. J193]